MSTKPKYELVFDDAMVSSDAWVCDRALGLSQRIGLGTPPQTQAPIGDDLY